MKKLIILLALSFIVLAGCHHAEKDLAQLCADNSGNWVVEFNECESGNQNGWCEEAGGEFQECESACRNNPEATICTMQCVQVCQF